MRWRQVVFEIIESFKELDMMSVEPFNNVENQIGFCGIWCGNCPARNRSVTELTRRYEETVKRARQNLKKDH